VPELVLPGIVSSFFNPKYLLILILILGLIFSRLGEKYPAKENIKFRAISRNLLNIILFVVLVMLALGLYKMKVWQILIVLALSIVLIISADKMLVSDSKK
jgi:cell division protein FtsW (lipid II flippase)